MRNKLLKKENVLEAAETIIVSEGLGQCSMRRIASVLGVAVGTLYNYYPSREELLIDLFSISWRRTIERTQKVVDPNVNRQEQILLFFEIIIEDVKNRNGLGKEIFIFNPYIKVVEEKTLNIHAELEGILLRIINQKEGPEAINRRLAKWIITILIDALVNERTMPDDEKEMLAQLIEMDFYR